MAASRLRLFRSPRGRVGFGESRDCVAMTTAQFRHGRVLASPRSRSARTWTGTALGRCSRALWITYRALAPIQRRSVTSPPMQATRRRIGHSDRLRDCCPRDRRLGGWGLAGWDDMDCDPAEVRARVLSELGEDYTPSTEQLARFQEFGRAVRSTWGSGAAAKVGVPSVRSMRQGAMLERICASHGGRRRRDGNCCRRSGPGHHVRQHSSVRARCPQSNR